MWILATIIISGYSVDSLGCPPTQRALEDQVWRAAVVRDGQQQQTFPLNPGHPFVFNFTVANADTYAVRVWGSNSAGAGCETVIVCNATVTTSVAWVPIPPPLRVYDVAGRRIIGPKPNHIYFTRDGPVVVDSNGRFWKLKY